MKTEKEMHEEERDLALMETESIRKWEKEVSWVTASPMQDEQEAVLIVDLIKRKKELETRLLEISEEEKAIENRLIEIGGIRQTTLPMTRSDWDRMQYYVDTFSGAGKDEQNN